MKRLCIGLTEVTPGWQSILDQLGIWFEKVDFTKSLTKQYSAIIISKSPTHKEQKKLAAYLHHGGSLMVPKQVKSFHAIQKFPTIFSCKLSTLYQDKSQLFIHGEGALIQLIFNPDVELANNKYTRKRFFFLPNKHPDELVSSVNKGMMISTIDLCLKELHIHRGLPYIKKWHSPNKNPIFGFRVDSDFGTKPAIKDLYHLARDFDITMTWFLHVEAHEDWLNIFNEFESQEIALHGYEHGTSKNYKQVFDNINKGKELLANAGFNTKGFCVPYGLWNDALAQSLNEFNFEYSSEFTIGYDTQPFYPVHKNQIHKTLQIPIHPICTGSLNRKNVTEHEMMSYFLEVMHQKISTFENVLFYHHPLQPGMEIWRQIFEKVNDLGLKKLSFTEYAQFWKTREEATVETYFSSEKREIHCTSSNPTLYISVSTDADSFYLLPAKKMDAPLMFEDKIYLNDVEEPTLSDWSELSANPLQLHKMSMLDWRNRKRL